MKYFKVIVSSTLLVASLMAMSPKVFQVAQSGIRPSLAGMRYLRTVVPTEDKKMRCNNCTDSCDCPIVKSGVQIGSELRDREVGAIIAPVRFPSFIIGSSVFVFWASDYSLGLTTVYSTLASLVRYGLLEDSSPYTNDLLLRSGSLAEKIDRLNRRIFSDRRDLRDDAQQKVECTELRQKIARAQAQLSKSSK